MGAVPADGDAVGKQVVSADGVRVQWAAEAACIRQELGDEVARAGSYATQGDAGVLVCVGALSGVGQ